MKAYRYEDVRYVGPEEGDIGYLEVVLREYDVVKTTPKGYWVELGFGNKRFVLKTARKRFALLNKTDALISFKARKTRQRSIYMARLNDCEEALAIADSMG